MFRNKQMMISSRRNHYLLYVIIDLMFTIKITTKKILQIIFSHHHYPSIIITKNMCSLLSSIIFIKSVSGDNVCSGVAYSRVENERFIKINFKAFRNNSNMIHEIRENSITSIVGKFTYVDSE